jgi:ABC-type uncharacterized transport system permease subunit
MAVRRRQGPNLTSFSSQASAACGSSAHISAASLSVYKLHPSNDIPEVVSAAMWAIRKPGVGFPMVFQQLLVYLIPFTSYTILKLAQKWFWLP